MGKSTPGCVETLTAEYIKRLRRWVKLEYVELPAPKQTASLSPAQRKDKEAALFFKHITPQDYVILLDEKGKQYTSAEWSAHLEKLAVRIPGYIVFLTGGPHGFSDEIYRRAQEKLSLSKMTFSHQIIRIMFAEQLYRALTIMKGLPYHNE